MQARHDGRGHDDLRPLHVTTNWLEQPAGSALVQLGQTRVLCTASIEDKVPQFLERKGEGWVTAEYAMIPAATHTRTTREVSRGRASGRTMEIQRLIGRALRSVVDRKALGERTVWVDCEVLQADGGTRMTSVTGGFIAMALALGKLQQQGTITKPPLLGTIAGISVGLLGGTPVLDLDYVEDSRADVDMNIVRTDDGRYVELQGTAEASPYRRDELDALLDLADKGLDRLQAAQREALGGMLDALLIPR